MKIVKTVWFPFGKYHTINIFGILFTKKDSLDKEIIRHESIHTKQMKEMLYIFFYLWYSIEWFVRLCQQHNAHRAYKSIAFEQEAYINENFVNYLQERKRYAWFKYLKN